MTRYLLIGAAVVLLLGGGGAVYYFFFFNAPGVTVDKPKDTVDLPIAGDAPVSTPTGDEPATDVPAQPEKVATRLVKIDKGPVVLGAVAFAVASTSANPNPDIAVNYVERESGNIFQYLVHAGVLTRTSNKTLPGIQEAKWVPSGSLAFVRYLSGDTNTTINTYGLPADGTNGYFLAQNVDTLAVVEGSILTLASGQNGSIATVARVDGSNGKQVFSTPLTSLRVMFAGKDQYFAYTKPSSTLSGYAYLINSTGSFERIAGPLNGLTALASPSGKWALVSYTSAGIVKMALVNLATHETTALPVATFAEKCVWTKEEDAAYCGVPVSMPTQAAYPDDWYQGVAHFSDRIWKISVAGRFAELILDFPKDTESDLDAVGLAVDPIARILVFRNKNDGSLWSYEL